MPEPNVRVSTPPTDDPVVGHARVIYVIPIRQSEALAWSTPQEWPDPEEDAWIFEVEKAVKDRLPDLLDRATD